jgi:hypothetical protein
MDSVSNKADCHGEMQRFFDRSRIGGHGGCGGAGNSGGSWAKEYFRDTASQGDCGNGDVRKALRSTGCLGACDELNSYSGSTDGGVPSGWAPCSYSSLSCALFPRPLGGTWAGSCLQRHRHRSGAALCDTPSGGVRRANPTSALPMGGELTGSPFLFPSMFNFSANHLLLLSRTEYRAGRIAFQAVVHEDIDGPALAEDFLCMRVRKASCASG